MRKIMRCAGEVLVFLCILELGLQCGGFVLSRVRSRIETAGEGQKDSRRILCLGDSMTALGGIHSYPSQLERILNEGREGERFVVINGGLPRITGLYLVSRLEEDIIRHKPDMVIAMIGGNGIDDPAGPQAYYWARSLKIFQLIGSLSIPAGSRQQRKLKTHHEYLASGMAFQKQYRFSSAGEAFKKAIALAPGSEEGYVRYGFLRILEGKSAEQYFLKALTINPRNGSAYAGIGSIRFHRGDYARAIPIYHTALRYHPGDSESWRFLGRCYDQMKRYSAAEHCYRAAVETGPHNLTAFYSLSWFYEKNLRVAQAGEVLKKGLSLNPRSADIMIEQGWFYARQGSIDSARKAFKAAVAAGDARGRARRNLRAFENEIRGSGVRAGAERSVYRDEWIYNHTAIKKDYLELKNIIDRRGCTLVCVQYPLWDVGRLRSLFGNDARGIIFVDNEMNFKEAVMRDGYGRYFVDRCGGDFGHCTPEGNRMLAENIARCVTAHYSGRGANSRK